MTRSCRHRNHDPVGDQIAREQSYDFFDTGEKAAHLVARRLRSTYGEHSRVVLTIDRERDQPLMSRGGVRGARIESHGFRLA